MPGRRQCGAKVIPHVLSNGNVCCGKPIHSTFDDIEAVKNALMLVEQLLSNSLDIKNGGCASSFIYFLQQRHANIARAQVMFVQRVSYF